MATAGPDPRSFHRLAYDRRRSRTVLFGGSSGGSTFPAATWEWNGSQWSQSSAAGPSGRFLQAMAYDESLQRTVLFGGFDGANTLVDTWEWDGIAWQQSAAGPAARDHVNMTYDPARQALVLYGAGETWQRSARVWSRTQGQGPTAPTAELTYDAVGASPLLYEITPGGALQLWGWNGSTWSRRD